MQTAQKPKKRKPKDIHITLLTDPTKLVQPYKTTSSEDMPPNGDNSQQEKLNIHSIAAFWGGLFSDIVINYKIKNFKYVSSVKHILNPK